MLASGLTLPVFLFFKAVVNAFPKPIPYKQMAAEQIELQGKHPTRDLLNRLPPKLKPFVKGETVGYQLVLPLPG